jgi:SAM-dependent methyltransferase
MQWVGEPRPCPICGAQSHAQLGRRGGAAHRKGLGVETAVVRCRRCHGVYPYPTLVPQGNPYGEHSADEYFEVHDRTRKVESGRGLARDAERLLGRTGRLLELGCGRGDLLVGAREQGWQVRGVDMTAGFTSGAGDLEIEVASAEQARSLEERWDCIVTAAILEHVYQPVLLLRRIASALVPGGILFVDVPNECSLWTRVGNAYQRARGRSWAVNLSPTFPPFHVVGFCPRSLRVALDAAGLEVVSVRTVTWPLGHAGFGAFERAGVALVARAARWLDMSEGIVCWARKPLKEMHA